jgi:hypothetical protein
MEPITQEEVIESWLRQDLKKHSESSDVSPESMKMSEKASRLLGLNPDAATPFLKNSFSWHRVSLTESEFQQLHTVWENLGIPDYTVEEFGHELSNPNSKISNTIADSDVAGERIREVATNCPENPPANPLIITVSETGNPRIADGNHRATGLALHMANGGEYHQQTAYVGFTTPPKLQYIIKGLRSKIYHYFNQFI